MDTVRVVTLTDTERITRWLNPSIKILHSFSESVQC